jgi:hypothetical protein
MTGLPGYNYAAFHTSADELRSRGWSVVNPAENAEPTTDPTWDDWMVVSLAQVRGASLLALLPGWESSRGALAEVALAGELGIPCYPLLDVIAGESDRG